MWTGDEITQLDIELDLSPPVMRTDPLRFTFRGNLQRRYNKFEQATDPIARIQVEGTVDPLPRWVNY